MRDRTGTSYTVTSGTLALAGGGILEGGVPVGSLTAYMGNAAISNPTHQWFVLLDQNRVVLAITADDTTTPWAATTEKTLSFPTPFVPEADMAVYCGIVVVATSCVLRAVGVDSGSTGLGSMAPIMSGNTGNTGLTTPNSLGVGTTAATMTSTGALIYFHWSAPAAPT